MKIAFVEIWNNNKKRYYLYKDERIVFDGNNFKLDVNKNLKEFKYIDFKIAKDSIKLESNNFINIAGSKRSTLEIKSSCFFYFLNYLFFIDFASEEFNLTGLYKDENYVKEALEIARTDKNLLILGDSGTGKELLAKNIHFNSNRKYFPFSVIDCSTINNIFGNVKGAYTNAKDETKGLFLKANGGTVFFDNIDRADKKLQRSLLSIIDYKEIKRVGDDKFKKHNVRIIFSSRYSLDYLFKKDLLLKDLYYRIEHVLYIPNLIQRKNKFLDLIDFFIPNLKITKKTLLLLYKYNWPGNVREFINLLYKIHYFGERDIFAQLKVKSKILPFYISSNIVLDDFLRQYIIKTFKKHGNIKKVSEILDICSITLLAKMREYNIQLDY